MNRSFNTSWFKRIKHLERDYKINDLVWAKMRGFRPWPGLITELPKNITPPRSKKVYCVFFFGSRNYGLLEPEYLRPYEDVKDVLSTAAKPGPFMTAVKDIEAYKSGDMSVLKQPKEELKYPDDSSSDESNLSSTSKNKTVNSRRKSLTKQEVKNDKVPQKNLPRKRLSTTPVNENKSKRKRQICALTPEDTSVKQNRNGGISPISLQPELYTPHPQLRSLPTPLSRPESPPIDMQSFSEDKKKKIIPSKLKIGVIGLGTVGSNLAKHMLKTGHSVSVWNRSTEKSEIMEQIGAEVAKSPGDLANASDIIFCCVPNTEAALDIAFGDNGVIHGISEGKSYVELSGISAETSKDIAEGVISRGGRYLEVRLQGDRIEAEAGTMILIAAGDRRVYNDCETCFASFSKVAMFLGEPGIASTVYLIVQLFASVTFGALAESLALANKLRLSVPIIMEILENSNLNCRFVTDGCRTIYENNFKLDLSGTNILNDIKNVLHLSNLVEQRLNVGAMVFELFKAEQRNST